MNANKSAGLDGLILVSFNISGQLLLQTSSNFVSHVFDQVTFPLV